MEVASTDDWNTNIQAFRLIEMGTEGIMGRYVSGVTGGVAPTLTWRMAGNGNQQQNPNLMVKLQSFCGFGGPRFGFIRILQ